MANMFDENGNYNKTEWKPGDRITAGKLNKIEESLEAINNNDIERHKEADERLDALEEQNEVVEERFDELEDLVADNKSEVDTAIYEVHSKMDRLEQEMNDGIDTVEAIAHTVDDKIAEADASMKAQVNQGKADMEAMVAEVEGELEEITRLSNLKNNEPYNITEFGITPGTSRNNCPDITEILNNISKTISFNTGDTRRLYVPAGYYKITDKVIFNRCSIEGDNNAAFILDGDKANICFTPYKDQSLVYESYIIGIGILGQNGAKVGLTLNKGSQIYVEKVNIIGFDIGLELIQTDISHFIRLTVQECNVGVLCNSVTGSTVENGNFYGNGTDFKFMNNSGGIHFTGNYFENSENGLLFDNSEGDIRVTGLYFNGNMIVRNIEEDSRFCIAKNISDKTFTVNNFTISGNRFVFNNLSENMFNIDFQGGNALGTFGVSIQNNQLYNDKYPDGYILKAVGNSKHQVQIIFEDNLMSSGNVNILDGTAWITGIDRSGVKLTYINNIHGELLLHQPDIFVNREGAISWYSAGKMPRYYDGTDFRCIPFRGEYLADSSATDIETLKKDFNALLKILRDCKVMKSY